MAFKFNVFLKNLDQVIDDHLLLKNVGINTHTQIDTHINNTSIHFSEISISHLNIQDIGTNTHAQIDSHISTSTDPHGANLTQTGYTTFNDYLDVNVTDSANSGTGVDVSNVLNNAVVLGIAITSITNTKHTVGTSNTVAGYLGRFEAQSNGNVTQGYGVHASSKSADTYTPTITYMIGSAGFVSAQDATVTSAISIYGSNPTVDTGSITNSWAALFAGDVQINTGKKLIMEGSILSKGDTYIVYDNIGTTLDFFVNGTEVLNISSTQAEFLKRVKMTGITGTLFEFPADAIDPTGGGGAATGRIPVLIGGVTRYLAYY